MPLGGMLVLRDRRLTGEGRASSKRKSSNVQMSRNPIQFYRQRSGALLRLSTRAASTPEPDAQIRFRAYFLLAILALSWRFHSDRLFFL